ncbi:MAG: alpha/beta fold hydrolase [Kordiimonadaceae bacterium]|nr:alpha/beta fold hydrolase [Kordiimonadaceae bacterium]
MDLFYRKLACSGDDAAASKETLLLLHGLFGSADNVGGIARILQHDFNLIAVDHRNHGRSPHADQMDYNVMAADVLAVMDNEGLENAYVFGHSMGGKVAMQLALTHPSRVKKLIVADIAPVKYEAHHDSILAGMKKVEEEAPESRKEAMRILASYESEADIISFLATNWRRDKNGQWGWRINLDVIAGDYANIAAANSGSAYAGDVLFLRGGTSDYIKAEHRETILKLFPKATVRTIEGVGHWLHAEKPDMVARAMNRFLT